MKGLPFIPILYKFEIDEEKLFLQVLLAFFALSFVYIFCKSMRICGKQYKKTKKKITNLGARLEVVLDQQTPVFDNILCHNRLRYRRSLIASYLRELKNELGEPVKYPIIFPNFPNSSLNKNVSCSSIVLREKIDLLPKQSNEIFSIKEETVGESVDQENLNKINCKGKLEKDKNYGLCKSPLESKIFKTLEGPGKRLRVNPNEKRKTKIPRWNVEHVLKNVQNMNCGNLTVCTALTNTNSPFKVRSFRIKNRFIKKESVVNLLPGNDKSQGLLESSDSNFQAIKDIKDSEFDTNQETNFTSGIVVQEARENSSNQEVVENQSVESSTCESDSESESCSNPCLQVPCNRLEVPYKNVTCRPNTHLTTINEESAEENCLSE